MVNLKEKFGVPLVVVVIIAIAAGFLGGYLARGIEPAQALLGQGADVSAAQSNAVLNIPRS
ncbi:MAG: hypothetical protein HY454_03850, partial [Parcubacteria group bacterium]|nr:hypothetical protein [Parcubacteria group bacterium]